jgi:two-component system sensor histidine kinase KdpD
MTEPELQRPNPDALLAEIQREEQAAKRGQLKIFFGMCPGVGKTYAMLQAAQRSRLGGTDVVVGLVETHGRAETEALLAGLEVIPRKALEYRGVALTEMNLDGLLARRPKLALVDELAHTNVPGSRHPKRYQDVLELLDAGIDVYTTLNVQHLESRVDVVQQITGVTVRETVPDSVVDQADEIEIIDLTPDQLRKRLAEGKVYFADRAATAAENFFREENLTALREMALRCTTEQVDRELRDVMRAKRIGGRWASGQRLAVAVGPSPFSGPLIRWTRRIASAMDASWVAIYVETSTPLDETAQTVLTKNLSLARQLGAEVVMTRGDDVAAAVLEVAREHHVTQVVVGRPDGNPLWEILRGGSLVSKLMRRGAEIDIHVVRAEKGGPPRKQTLTQFLGQDLSRDFGWGAATVAVVTLASWFLQRLTGYQAVGILYMLSIVVLATMLNRWAVLFVAALSAVLWDFLFIPPAFTFHINSLQDRMMFAMFFIVAVVVGRLTSRLRTREIAERKREQRTQALNRLLEGVSASTSLEDGLHRAVREMDLVFGARTAVLLSDVGGRKLEAVPHPAGTFLPDEREVGVATWAFEKSQVAGRFTDTLPDAAALYVPLTTSNGTLGILGVNFTERNALTLDERELLETFAVQIAALVERYRLIEGAGQARLAAESERLHRTLLDSVSHELKTPLAVIEAATDGLDVQLTEASVPLGKTFLDEIKQANKRLSRVVSNLLDMTRIETGRLPLNLEWCEPAELLQSAAEMIRNEISLERINISAPDDMPLVRLDFGLMEQALCNLLTNAATYSPADKPIQMSAQLDDKILVLRVADQGIGLTTGEETKVFEKFYRGVRARPGGTGLGLSIVRGFARAHHGEVIAENNPAGGAVFTIRLPVETSSKPA